MSTAPIYKSVKIDKNGGSVSLKVSNPNSPQSISGETDEYAVLSNPPLNTYSFNTAQPQNILGKPDTVDQHYFAVDGAVLNNNDNPPTQYRVQIEIWQDGKQLDIVYKPESGPGQISNTDQYFLHKFQLLAS